MKKIIVEIIKQLPQGLISREWGAIARRRKPRLFVEALKRVFVSTTGIDMTEAAEPVENYPTLQDLFVRQLKSGARPIATEKDAVTSPVDGCISALGTVQKDSLLQVKGRDYRLSRLLDDKAMAKRFEGGAFVTLYLAPHDYHRIHAPVAGKISEATVIPGGLMPVFPLAVEHVDELLARNERLITYIDSPDAGRVAIVKVGATLVGRISLAYDPGVHTNRPGQLRRRLSYTPPKNIKRGEEIGAFELGSTVVLIMEPGRICLDHLHIGDIIKMGSRLGCIAAPKVIP